MVRRFEPAFVFELIQEHKATDMCLVPTMANALINAPDRGNFDTVQHAPRDDRRRGVVARTGGARRKSDSPPRSASPATA